MRGLCLFSAFRLRIGSRVRLAGRLRALGVFELAPWVAHRLGHRALVGEALDRQQRLDELASLAGLGLRVALAHRLLQADFFRKRLQFAHRQQCQISLVEREVPRLVDFEVVQQRLEAFGVDAVSG